MKRTFGRTGLLVGTGTALLLLAAGACHGNGSGSGGSGTTTGGTGNGGSAPAPFTPQGCGFSIAARPEYTDFAPGSATVGATPNIRRVRLGLGGNVEGATGRADPSTSVAVAWQTDDGTLASEVAWGTDPDPSKWPAQNRLSGVTWLTPAGTINPAGAERMHEAYLCGLTPATTYHYRVGGGPVGAEVWSDVLSFSTTPAAGSTPVTLALTGDSRGEHNDAWRILQRRLHLLGPTLQIFSGDVIDFAQDQAEWEEWLDRAARDADDTYLTLGQTLTLAAHGNHENHTALFYGNVVLPQQPAKYPDYGELFYSVDVGPAHIVVFDEYFIVNPGLDDGYAPAFQAWLEADLTAADANRAKVPWIITAHHHHEYSGSTHGQDADVLLGRKFFAPLWQKYHVDLAVSGHSHEYERSKPLSVGADVDNPTVTDPTQGTVYVVCAGAGADGYPASTASFTDVSKDYVGGTGGILGLYALVSVDPHNLKLEAHELHADASDPVFDSYTITK